MIREYIDGSHSDVRMFIGTEIEKTPAHGLRTLFVVGIQPVEKILDIAESRNCRHIYLGANQSFKPSSEDDWKAWDEMICELLKHKSLLITIDHDLRYSESFLETSWSENRMVIPLVSLKMPYVRQYNYNTCIKIDDSDFAESNPGVWVHRLHDVLSTDKFTSWEQYTQDLPLE